MGLYLTKDDMNKLSRFNAMDFDQKAMEVWQKGTPLISREENGMKSSLYSLDGYFVQVFFNLLKMEIERIEATDFGEVADFYLEKIELDSFF